MAKAAGSDRRQGLRRLPQIAILLLVGICGHGAQAQSQSAGIAEVNGTKLYYEMAGNGHPLVLIHSGGSDRRLYDGQFQVFSRRYKVIRYDLRGAGKSEVPQILYSNTEDLYALLRFLKVDKAYVLGLSRGGGVAIDFTLEHPEMVDALIMVSSGGGTRPIAQASQQMISAAIKAGREEGIARAVQIWLDDPYQGVERSNTTARQRMKEILTENLPLFLYFWDSPVFRAGRVRKTEQRLSEIRVPTLIIGGQRDDPEARLNRDDMEKSIPGAKKIVFPGLPHLVNLYNPEEFNRVVLEFLSNF